MNDRPDFTQKDIKEIENMPTPIWARIAYWLTTKPRPMKQLGWLIINIAIAKSVNRMCDALIRGTQSSNETTK